MSAEGLADCGRKSIEEKALLAGLPKTAGAGQLLKSIKSAYENEIGHPR